MARGIAYCNYKITRKPQWTHCGPMKAYMKSALEYNFDFGGHISYASRE